MTRTTLSLGRGKGEGILRCVILMALVFGSLAWDAFSSPAVPIPAELGRIHQGSLVVFPDAQGQIWIQDGGLPLLTDGGINCGHKGHTRPGDWEDLKVERLEGRSVISGRLPGMATKLEQVVSIEGERIRVEITRTGPWPEGFGWASFQAVLPMARFQGASFLADGRRLPYPPSFSGEALILDGIKRLELLPDKPAQNVVLESPEGWLSLSDGRRWNGYFHQLSFALSREGESSTAVFYLTLPKPNPGHSDPGNLAALRYSPLGYSAAGKKEAFLEWPWGLDRPPDTATLERKGKGPVKTASFGPTQDFMHLRYAALDFSDLSELGEYRITWSGGSSPWFPIKASLFSGLADATLDVFLPWQMCHAEVVSKDPALAHRACHLDDGVRVPAFLPVLDGFQSYEVDGTPYKAGDPIPCAIGGWHDAGDNDLNVTAQSHPTHRLALTYEEFGAGHDRATLDMASKRWIMDKPDGISDLLQQVEWGLSWLLAMQQADGRVYVAVVEKPSHYGAEKAPEDVTDNVHGTGDEGHVYADYHSDAQMKAAIAYAACARIFKASRPELAARALEAARKALGYYLAKGDKERPTGYFQPGAPSEGRLHLQASAWAEMYLSTLDPKWLLELESMAPKLATLQVEWPSPRRSSASDWGFAPPFLARLIPVLKPGALRDACVKSCTHAAEILGNQLRERPWPAERYSMWRWGNNGFMLNQVHDAYWLAKAKISGLSMADTVSSGLWVLGLHPLNNLPLVSGLSVPGPSKVYSGRIHARNGFTGGFIPGAVVPGIGGSADSKVMSYGDDYGFYVYNEACIYTAAEHIFAMAALSHSGF